MVPYMQDVSASDFAAQRGASVKTSLKNKGVATGEFQVWCATPKQFKTEFDLELSWLHEVFATLPWLPSPTMDESLTLAQLVSKHSVPSVIAEELAVQPFGITTVQQLSNYFDNK
eukprot:1660553-Karenia_brevis.AAC.1